MNQKEPNDSFPPVEITAEELSRRLKCGEPLEIVDVREGFEFEISNLGGRLIPLGDLPHHLAEIPTNQEFVILCHHGIRSLRAAIFLRQSGFPLARSLKGGIDTWSLTIDPKVRRY